MYNNPLRILFTTLVISSFVIGLSCASQSNSNLSNSNQSANSDTANSNTANANQDVDAKSADLGKCELAWTEQERKDIEDDMLADIRDWGSKKLKKSLDGDGTVGPWMTVQVRRSPGANDRFYEAIITGTLAGNDQFKELTDILNNYDDKKECIRRAFFLPTGSSITPTSNLRDRGFEWSACDFPMRPCSDGSCNCR